MWEAFQRALKRDRARCNVTKISELGLVEMTRKRTRESLVQVLTEPCPLCEGAGVIKSTTTLAYEILREVRRSGGMAEGEQIELECAPRVADLINRSERDYLDNLEKRFHKPIVVVGQKSWRPDQYRVAGRMSTDIIAAEAAEAQVALPPPPRAASGGNGHSHAGNGGGGGGAGAGAGRGKRRRRGGRGRGRDAASA